MNQDSNPPESAPLKRNLSKATLPWAGILSTCFCALFGSTAIWAAHSQQPSWVFIVPCVIAFLAGGWSPTLNTLEGLPRGKINVDLLMVFAALGAASIGDWMEGTILLFLFSFSGTLESFAMYRTTRSIESLIHLRPREAMLLEATGERLIPAESLQINDLVRVRPGELFPVDGEILEGETWADESTLTGESEMILKPVGSAVFAGTINGQGSVIVRMTKAGEDSTLARIVKMVHEAQAQKTPTQRLVESWQRPYVVGVLLGASIALFGGKLIHTQSWHDAFYHAMVLLVAASPCAVVLSSPSVMLSAIARAARHGVLFKGALHLETLGKVESIAFDKTGTITMGKPSVTDIWVQKETMEKNADSLLRLAAAVEHHSEHPLGIPLVREAKAKGLFPSPLSVDSFQSFTGKGVWARVQEPGQPWFWVGIGRESLFLARGMDLPLDVTEQADRFRGEGKSALFVLSHKTGETTPLSCGVIGVADQIRPEAIGILESLRQMGIKKTIILTGDHERVAEIIGREIGADEVRAGLLPEQKVFELARLKENETVVAMVGDGVNDAPALSAASVGIAMGGAGTDVALEVADVVLMRDDLAGLPFALGISRLARKRVRQNMKFSFGVIGILIVGTFLDLPLWLGVICHEGSTVLVGLNGLRILWERIPGANKILTN